MQRQTKAEIAAQFEGMAAEKRRLTARPVSEKLGNLTRAWWNCFFGYDSIFNAWPIILLVLFWSFVFGAIGSLTR